MPRHRRLLALFGSPADTAARAREAVQALDPAGVLWVTSEEAAGPFTWASPPDTRKLLGRSFDAVVLDLHQGLDADVVGRCQGFIWGGGAFLLRLPPRGEPPPGLPKLAGWPFAARDVGQRFWRRFSACLDAVEVSGEGGLALTAPEHAVVGTDGQRRAVEELSVHLRSSEPTLVALTADRGRGKSSALGLALADAHLAEGEEVAVTSGDPGSVLEVFRFATGRAEPLSSGPIRYAAPWDLVFGGWEPPIIIVDEAAQLPVPLLQRLAVRHPRARMAFASTTRGYEGTGRGFVLRFLEWLAEDPRPLTRLSLEEPIRWEAGDPLERFCFEALLLDAQPAPVDVAAFDAAAVDVAGPDEVVATELDRDALVADEQLLQDFFGLLVHAHYRTTPGDLQRILDAPNLRLHALTFRGRVIAATLVALEGGLPRDVCEKMAAGRLRIQGHALPDTLISHAHKVRAGELSMVRSVRVATHPDLRRRGLATRLIEHVHASYQPDLFGTLFGATWELLRFRREVGYELVRVGASRGSRTGEPAAVMLRPESDAARTLLDELRQDLARNLPLQLELLDVEGELVLDPRLDEELRRDLPQSPPLDDEARRDVVVSYLFGPRPYESAAADLRSFVDHHKSALVALEPRSRSLLEARVLHGRSWVQVTQETPWDTVPSAMRGLRRAFRALVAKVEPSWMEPASDASTE